MPASYARQPRLMSLALANNNLSVPADFFSTLPQESSLLYLNLHGNYGAPGRIQLDAVLRATIFRSSYSNRTRSERAFVHRQAHVLDLSNLRLSGDISDSFVQVCRNAQAVLQCLFEKLS